MKSAAVILGALGGVVGVATGQFVVAVAGIHAETTNALGWLATVLSFLAMLGAAMVGKMPKLSGVMLIIAALSGFAVLQLSYLPAGFLLLTGGAIALWGAVGSSAHEE